MADKHRRMSAVWKHFIATATNENKASSSICDCMFPRGGSSVKGYTTHSENNYLSFTITYIQLYYTPVTTLLCSLSQFYS